MVLGARSADGPDASSEVIALSQVARPPPSARAVKTAEAHEPIVSRASESVARPVELRPVAERRDSTGGYRSTFSIPSKAASDG